MYAGAEIVPLEVGGGTVFARLLADFEIRYGFNFPCICNVGFAKYTIPHFALDKII
jgi:hypothetical protein